VSESSRQVLWAFGFAGLGILRSPEIDPLPRRVEVIALPASRGPAGLPNVPAVA
jgi:hypothetical protein